MKENGIEIATYRAGNEKSRARLINKESEGIRFSIKGRNTEEQRRSTLASETEDVASEDLIFLQNALGDIALSRNTRLSSSNKAVAMYDKVNGTNVAGFFNYLRNNKQAKKGEPSNFHIANAGTLLEQYGIKGKFMVGDFTFSRTHTDNEDHKLGVKEWVDVINNLNNPLAITSYKGLPNEYRIYTYATINGKNICVGVNVSLQDGVINLSNIISAYGRDVNTLLGKEKVNLLYPATEEELKRRISQGSTAHNSLLNAPSSASGAKVIEEFENPKLSDVKNVKTRFSIKGRNAEEQFIIDEAKKNGTWMKTPNGNPTHLTEKQWAQVRTKSFKKWFGDWEAWFKKNFLLNGTPVANLTGNEFARLEGKTLTDQVAEYFDSIGNKALSPLYGDVILDRRGADDSLAHGMGRNKAIAYASVKDVIENGVLINYDVNHKNRGYDSAIIAAPITINNERYVCEVVITRMEDNRFYLHEVTSIEKLQDAVFLTNLGLSPSAHLGAAANVLQNVLSAKESSKIVDENGEPMVVYHDTNSRIFINRETGENWDDLDWGARAEWEGRSDWDEYWEEQDFYTFDNKNHGRRNSYLQ